MSTLSLEVDDDLLARATELAAARKMTLSEMLQRLLRVMAAPTVSRDDLPPVTRQALGMLPPMSDEEVHRLLDEERIHRHGSL